MSDATVCSLPTARVSVQCKTTGQVLTLRCFRTRHKVYLLAVLTCSIVWIH